MTIRELITIKRAADCAGLNRNTLGAAVLSNIVYSSVRPQHVINFKLVLQSVVNREVREASYFAAALFNKDYKIGDDPWEALQTRKPSTEEDLRSYEQFIPVGERATDRPPVMVLENKPSTEDNYFKRLFDKMKGLL